MDRKVRSKQGNLKRAAYVIKQDLKGPELRAQLAEVEKVFQTLRDDTPDCGGMGSSLQKLFSDFLSLDVPNQVFSVAGM